MGKRRKLIKLMVQVSPAEEPEEGDLSSSQLSVLRDAGVLAPKPKPDKVWEPFFVKPKSINPFYTFKGETYITVNGQEYVVRESLIELTNAIYAKPNRKLRGKQDLDTSSEAGVSTDPKN